MKGGSGIEKRKNKKNSKAAEKALKVTINGKEETVYEQETPENETDKNMTFSNWEEKRRAEQEVAASHEHPDEDEFNWDSEEDKVFKEDPKVVPPYQKKKTKLYAKGKAGAAKPVKRVAATIAFAAVIGTGLGLFALNISGNKEASAPASLDDSLAAKRQKPEILLLINKAQAQKNRRHQLKVHIKRTLYKPENSQMKRVPKR